MPNSDIQSKRITTAASLGVGPARIRQVQVLTGAGAARLTVTDGSGGRTVLDLDYLASDSHSVNIPDYGIRCQDDVLITAMTNITAMTVFYS